jgi:hypothetical protein
VIVTNNIAPDRILETRCVSWVFRFFCLACVRRLIAVPYVGRGQERPTAQASVKKTRDRQFKIKILGTSDRSFESRNLKQNF